MINEGEISLESFQEYFIQEILADSESRGLSKSQAFFENVCEEMTKTGDLSTNYTESEYIKKGMEINGYDFDDERSILSLIVHQFYDDNEIITLTLDDIKSKFKNLKNLLERISKGFYKELEETSTAHHMAYNVYNLLSGAKVDKIRLVLITDGKITKSMKIIGNELFNDIVIEYKIIDINYIYQIFMSEMTKRTTDINLSIPFLKTDIETDKYTSYLSVLNGQEIYNIYDKYGQQLFEQNVRTFLQFKGGVNKGLKNTIEFNPDMFFAYNNGLTVTASSIEIEDNRITRINNFQIVNGAQTTSAIYTAKKNNRLDISKIKIQLKLSVVNDVNKSDEFVSKVSQYANSQNKISASDFFSNSPFHKEMKMYSQRTWAPSVDGSQKRTKWFYERARGEFLNEQLYLTKAQKNKFLSENPKTQFIDKTLLAKVENAWNRKPYVVSKGAQASFSYFADTISKELEKNEMMITETYFKEAVAKIILFKKTEKIISKATWYANSYRAQIVAYTLSYILEKICEKNMFLNFNLIWEKQNLSDKLCSYISDVAENINLLIMSTEFQGKNIGQWFKREEAWNRIKIIDINNVKLDESCLINEKANTVLKKDEIREKKLEKEADSLAFVYNESKENWQKVYSYFNKYRYELKLSTAQHDILEKFVYDKFNNCVSSKQAKILHELYKQAVKEDVISGEY